jgi:hypothetical protein
MMAHRSSKYSGCRDLRATASAEGRDALLRFIPAGALFRAGSAAETIRVMRGLDPRIHHQMILNFTAMDCRVKPGNDGG